MLGNSDNFLKRDMNGKEGVMLKEPPYIACQQPKEVSEDGARHSQGLAYLRNQ